MGGGKKSGSPWKDNGGKRVGSGRKHGSTRIGGGGRARMRALVDDPKRWKAYVKAIDAALRAGDPGPLEKAFEHGYGRPPQALDVNFGGVGQEGGGLTFAVVLSTGQPLPPAATGLPGPDAALRSGR